MKMMKFLVLIWAATFEGLTGWAILCLARKGPVFKTSPTGEVFYKCRVYVCIYVSICFTCSLNLRNQ